MTARLSLVVVAALAVPAQAQPARLGDAFAAYDRGELTVARDKLAGLSDPSAIRDYALWLRGMVGLRLGDVASAERAFRELAKLKTSRFAPLVPWRLADCAWAKGDRAGAAKQYEKVIAAKDAAEIGDVGTAMFRIAEAAPTASAYRALLLAHPAHPLAADAERRMLELGGAPLGPTDRIERAKQLTAMHLWDEAVAELALVPADVPADVAYERDYWLGTTLFDMRRRYADAGKLLLGVYAHLGGDRAPEAMFHGARALSRADHDDDAITWYHKVVAAYPHTAWAQEAQFLSGWLEFNRGHYGAAIAPLEDSLARYPHSKWVDDSLWFLAMAHWFQGDPVAAKAKLEKLAERGGALEGGKAVYWLGRIDQKLGDTAHAKQRYHEVVTKYPFSWYALLAHGRLGELGDQLGPFGDGDGKPRGPSLAGEVDETLAKDDLIARADALIAAGMGVDAGAELARGETAFLHRHDRAKAFAMLLDRYVKAGNYNRPWMLAVSYSGAALDGPPEADAKRWWLNAYPRAYRELVEKYQALGDNPEGYLYSIMRKESGFDPHDLSYADAQGLLQMIPPTTLRVARALGIPYDPGKLYEPEYNVRTGSWYIGHLLAKFKTQIPIGAGSFNSGPKPVMKWLDQNGDRDIDELVELVPFTQTREYMKKVTENYARYRYLYDHEIYEQPLKVDKHYVVDQLTY
jgi:soluble lytic murein transglycosylase